MQKKLFTELGLSPDLLKAINKVGYEEATPIQSAAIPPMMEGRDVVGQSQTGSGKTAAFAVPAIEKADPAIRAPQTIVLCPTRELAIQVAEEVAKLAAFKRGIRELPIYGGQSYERQFRGLKQGAQIIVGTPGRVMDHLDRGTLQLDQIRMLVLDEADRMLDMGFIDDIKTILKHAPAERQTVLFSATLPRPILELIRQFTRDPVNIRIEGQTLTVPAIEQAYYEVDRRSKLDVLCRILDLHDVKYGLIFCATKAMVDDLTEHLQARGYLADKLHGDMSQSLRERTMGRFRRRAVEFLVATDVAARGLDVEDIEVVFNYDLPQDAEDYVHRIGRTGRAGKPGKAITFVGGREIYRLQNIMRFTKGKIRRERPPSVEEVQEKRANVFLESLREILEKGNYKRQDELVDRLLDQGHSPTDIASAVLHMMATEKARSTTPSSTEVSEHGRERRESSREGREYSGPRDRRERRPRDDDRRAPRAERRGDRFDERAGPVSHEAGMLRLVMNIGKSKHIMPGDVVGVIAGAASVPRESIGAIKLLPKVTLVDVAEEHAQAVLQKLNGIRFKGHRLTIAPAAEM
ncbi:MAG TPA: DEAD/DEAH box helicase [Verrucomicrobiae bacterium]|nr:DEAD/DEAH box helicase [Verrucomicrobiae bacterium]